MAEIALKNQMPETTLKDQLIILEGEAAAYRSIRKSLGFPVGHVEHSSRGSVFVEDPPLSLSNDNGPVLNTIVALRSAVQNFLDIAEETERPRDYPARIKQARSAIVKADEALRGSGWEKR